MATLTGITTHLSGSAGAWTFYRRLGTTVAKEKVESHRNKKLSEAQLDHLVRWSNPVAFWSVTQGCLRNGFSHKRQGQTDFNAFMSANLNRNEVYLTRNMVRLGASVAAPYQLTDGRLPTIGVVETGDGLLRSDIRLGEGFIITPDTTVREISHAVVDNNIGFKYGDRIFCLVALQYHVGTLGTPQVRVVTTTLSLDPYSHEPVLAIPWAADFLSVVEGCLGASAPLTGGIAWIHTRTLRDRPLVSTQHLVLSGAPDAPYSTPTALAAAKASYRR